MLLSQRTMAEPLSPRKKKVFSFVNTLNVFFFPANACLRVNGHPRQVRSLIHFTHTSLGWNTYIALSNREIKYGDDDGVTDSLTKTQY